MALKPSQIEDFITLYTNPNVPIDEIAKKFKLAPGSIYRMGFEFGLKRPRGPQGIQLNLKQLRPLIEAIAAELPAIVGRPYIAHTIPKYKYEMILLLGDIHSGRLTRSTNTVVLKNRLEVLAERIVEKAKLYGLQGSRLSIFELGDTVTGERLGQQVTLEELEHTVLTQCFRVAIPYLIRFTVYLLATFYSIDIYAVPGNHGVVSKPAFSSGSSWDNVVALGWQAAMLKYPQVKFNIATDDWYNYARVGDMDWLLMHGDQCRGTNPYNSIATSMLNWHRSMPKNFDAVAMGHFHHINQVREAYLTGCFITDDEWSREVVKREGDCAQLLLIVGGGKVHASIPIWLDDIKEEHEDLYR